MADTPLQSETTQANLASARDVASDAQDQLYEIGMRLEELAGLLYVLGQSDECSNLMKPAVQAAATLARVAEGQIEVQRQRFEDLWKELPAGENVAAFKRPN